MIILKELKPYNESVLLEEFNIDRYELNEILKILEAKKIVKYNLKNEIQFVYVGIIVVNHKLMFILPKYILCATRKEELSHMRNIVRLLNEFSEREKLEESDIEDINLEQETLVSNLIAIISFLLDDYIENGLYQNEIDVIEFNGDGDINWDKTIDQIYPVVIGDQWLYADLITSKSSIDYKQFITLLHGRVINECIDFFNSTGLNEILSYDLDIIDNVIDNMEEIDKIERELEKEIVIQFNDRKRRVLYAIKSYLERKSGLSDTKLLLYGTRNFKWIWEIVCGHIFDNEFVKKGTKSKYEVFGIESPKWNIGNEKDLKINDIEMKKNRLTPDILKVIIKDNIKYLLILDAKYYNVKLRGSKIQGSPGIEDITKQYLYHSALKNYIEDNKIDKVLNAFLVPTQTKTYVQGEVFLDFMRMYSNTDIKLMKLNVNEVIDMYSNNKKYNFDDFITLLENYGCDESDL
ncbi:llaJI restriction endonuclease family protein [Bacillus cereus 03BB102]|uniref:Type II restriction-modification system restriction subunit n=1 Tax=Bacillus cereus (strain 03BB102) TaxID=572264 RepID=A0A158RTX0_BACC3|nr:LlaJI family restriction endonuclease [Bacillus cereus]ACO30964.1 type II restriction-modification system restriction subunit [Bacillus cereus 03BB102]AJG55898.1 llaJI restriction endonuclease family protein [Bacillus cereus 03BB102]QPR82159.1 LlaJI family restriction endonuclease [Bacillus cereus]